MKIFSFLLILNVTNNVPFKLRESCRQIEEHKWHSINSILCHLCSSIFGALTRLNGPLFVTFSIIAFCFAGCGYRWHPDFPDNQKPTLVIPYAIGDDDGILTSEVIRTLTASGIANVHSREGDYLLKIAILNTDNQTVGYRYDKQKVSGEIKKNIVACEGRRSLTAEVTLYKGSSDTIVEGPYKITADTDYDYVDGDSIQDLAFINSEGVRTIVLPFSLGQLESIESAQEAAGKPLYEKLAQKIADTIFSARVPY